MLVTYTGNTIKYDDIESSVIDVKDIIHSLSKINRFVGHSTRAYSVLEHSLICYWMAVRAGYTKREQFLCLVHDFSEAYVGDCPSPLKALLPDFSKIEEKFEEVIYKQLDVNPPTEEESKKVKTIDLTALFCEMRDLTKHNEDVVDKDKINYDVAMGFSISKEFMYKDDALTTYFMRLFQEVYLNLHLEQLVNLGGDANEQ